MEKNNRFFLNLKCLWLAKWKRNNLFTIPYQKITCSQHYQWKRRMAINFHLMLIPSKWAPYVLNYKIFHDLYVVCLRQIYYQPMVFFALSCLPNASNTFSLWFIFQMQISCIDVKHKINNDAQFVLICSVLFRKLLLSVFPFTWYEWYFFQFYLHVNAWDNCNIQENESVLWIMHQ